MTAKNVKELLKKRMCEECGTDISHRHFKARFCRDCAHKRSMDSQARFEERRKKDRVSRRNNELATREQARTEKLKTMCEAKIIELQHELEQNREEITRLAKENALLFEDREDFRRLWQEEQQKNRESV